MSPLRVSVPDWCFYGALAEGPRYYELVRTLGVDAVEMVPPERHALARAAGLPILNQSGPGMQDGLNRLENHPRLLPEIRAALRNAAAAEIPVLIIFSGSSGGQEESEGTRNCRRAIEALLPDAERERVIDHPDYQACHGRYGFDLAAALGSPWLKLIYDIYHMERMGDHAAKDVAGNIRHVHHLHVAERPGRGRPMARGLIPYATVVPSILRAGYRGYWGLEFVPGGDPLADLKDSIGMLQAAAEGRESASAP